MGEEYLGLLQEGFDNRWIDVYENEGKYIDKNTEYNILNNSTKLNAKLVYNTK